MNLSIRTKIIAPFLILVLVMGLLMAWLARNASGRLVEERYERDITNFERQGALLTIAYTVEGLRNIKKAYGHGVELVRVRPADGMFLSTFEDPALQHDFQSFAREAGLLGGESAARLRNGDRKNVPWPCAGHPYRVFYGDPFEGETGKRYRFFFLVPEKEITEARSREMASLLLLDGVAMLLVLLLGVVIAGAITRPVRRLADATRAVADGGWGQISSLSPVDTSAGGEIGELADDFNRMLQELRASQDKLVKSERLAAVGAIASGIAHEIRNPLTAMRLTVELLQRQADAGSRGEKAADPGSPTAAPQFAEGLARMKDEIDHLSLIIDQLLTIGKPTPLEPEDTDVICFVNDVAAFLKRQIDHAGIRLTVDTARAGSVHVDPNKIRQVLVNLILNGIQAMPHGGELTVIAYRPDTGGMVIEVKDTGGGIPEEVRDKVFDPFFSTREAGSGIGLAISRQIVEEHGGTIDFTTSPKGTKFRVTLPGANRE